MAVFGFGGCPVVWWPLPRPWYLARRLPVGRPKNG